MLTRRDIDCMLLEMLAVNSRISDLFFSVGRRPLVEIDGEMHECSPLGIDKPLTPFQAETIAQTIIEGEPEYQKTIDLRGSVDLSYQIPGRERFRVNIFKQKGRYSLVLRKFETQIKTLEDMGLSSVFKELAKEKNGLVLVTGATGSGKSTLLAGVLNEINETRAVHILTIEDPIEFVHPHKLSTFNQRELGADFDNFASAMRAALRQAPKVILVGEIRDRETADLALDAASTGHLVLSTLHSIDAGQTINRIVGLFEKKEEPQIRTRLAECLKYVVSQRLLPKEEGGRVASREIMGVNLRTKELIINGESEEKTFYDIIESSSTLGWHTHDQDILSHYENDLISEETAMLYCTKRTVVHRGIDRIKQQRGITESSGPRLKLKREAKEDW